MSSQTPWMSQHMPDLSGKTLIVTGGNSGLGYEAALQLAAPKSVSCVYGLCT